MKLNVNEMSLEELKNKKMKMIGFDYENPEICMEAVKQNGCVLTASYCDKWTNS